MLLSRRSVNDRRRRNRRGRLAEHAAALLLVGKGYRILARRHRTALGEIDLIAVRRGRLVFVEVKQRARGVPLEAVLSPHQMMRIRNAADLWLGRQPRFQSHAVAFDLVVFEPWRLPRHVMDAF
jgi:putative endonuclease